MAEVVFFVSDLLREDFTPGLVSAGLGIALLAFLAHLGTGVFRRCLALRWLRRMLEQTADEAEFSEQIDEITRALQDGGRRRPRRRILDAWREYRETFVPHEEGGRTIQRNTVRPGVFFNLDDLDFGPGCWRILPGLFVTVGLFLTFLGLISALHAMNSDEGISEEAMTNLLSVASAKFIMSLSGLLCSILFTIALRFGMGRVEASIHGLNVTFERCLSFISLEDLAVEQLSVSREHREHFRTIGTELVAQLDRPLREELPRAIGASVREAVEPIAERIGEVGGEGMTAMVRDLSSRFTQDVDGALGQASERLAEAADRIGGLVDRMDQSSGTMGREMEGAVGQLGAAIEELRTTMTAGADDATRAFGAGVDSLLAAMNETLEGIRQNTSDGATALREAALEMRAAAEGIRNELETAARDAAAAADRQLQNSSAETSEAISGAGAAIFKTTEEAAARARQELLDPLDALADALDALVETLAGGTEQLGRLATNVRNGADATAEASQNLRESARTLIEATLPVRESVDKLLSSTDQLTDSTRQVAESARANTDSAGQALAAVGETIRGSQGLISDTKQAVQDFETYSSEFGNALDVLRNHVVDLQGALAPALETMREITEQQLEFQPASSRR
ncbi:MAG: hypothetical protein F4Y86_05340 [Gammaproteobacteria bacterium]|nr:hypothetical protein [Gammaproteobacteria bacterium]